MPDTIDPPIAQAAYDKALKRIQEAAKTGATELALYDLPLTELPPAIGTCTALKTLKLAHEWDPNESKCRLQTLPAEIVQLTNLTRLDLSQNSLSQLPAEIVQLTELKELDLSQNSLSQLPAQIGQLTELTRLDLSQNSLSQLPAEIVQLTNLTRLDLSQNSLSQLPAQIGQLTKLTYLYLSQNSLSQLPAQISQLTKLTSLNFRQNSLSQLPAQIGQLTKLTFLELSQNSLSQLPAEIGQLTNLTSLYLSQNSLSQLPAEIGQLTNLKELYLSQNRLSQLPAEIGQLTRLASLYLSQNRLSQLPAEIGQLTNLKELDLRQNSLSQLPAEIGQLTNLTDLELRQNSLSQLPAEIGQLTNLTSLYLSGNSLSQLPVEIGQLTNLKELYLMQNSLSQLPAKIGQLTKLKELDLSQNSLSQLPAEIGQLTKLTSLGLSQNSLRQLPAQIGQLTNLKELYLMQNSLSQLPAQIGQLTKLTSLGLSQNSLRQLPAQIGQLTKLRALDLSQNPDLPIPSELIQRGQFNPQIILDFWQEYLSQQTRPLHEVKMILVGEGSVGKTSLVRRLTADEFDPGENQTKGIHIELWAVAVAASQVQGSAKSAAHQVDVHIWDFGGQEIMHATHQFFLTERSLYLLVLDARQGERESRVEYWLSLINSYAAHSPILIVLNKCDQHFLDLNRRGLLAKYPNIAGFVSTSAATGQGLSDLKQTISGTIATMPHVDTPFPLTWFNVKERLEALADKHNYLAYEAYRHICQEEKVVEDSKQRTLIRFLHDLGIVLNFQDDARVRDTSILNPEWVTQGVYSLLNQEQLAQQGGVLVSQQLSDLLDGALYPLERQGFILSMMEKFELAFPFDRSDRYLIPDLLPVEEPEFAWDDSQSLQFAYHYHVLPYSILHRFMVRQHMRICEKVLWRTGVMLQHEGLQALIKADIEDGVIRIAINGAGRRREFLSNLRFTFESLHQYITGIQPKEVVPIPGYPEVEPVPYQFLLTLEKNRVEQQFFPGMSEPIGVQWLLDGIESPTMRQFDQAQLREILHTRFDKRELQELLLELDVNPNDLNEETGGVLALELVSYLERRGRTMELVEAVRGKRPFLFR